MAQQCLPRQATQEDKFVEQERDGQNKFWSQTGLNLILAH
jgi:hypothetical protein